MPWIYALASVVLFVLLLPALLVHPKLRSGLARRLGFYPRDFLAHRTGPRVWLHGASAGDLLALLPVHRELRRRRPDVVTIVSTMTNSGEAIARTRFQDADAITFVPYDLPFVTRRAAEAIKPDLLVLEYTELWPNLVRAVRRRGGRVAVTNGRLAEKNVERYRLLFALAGNVLREIDLLLMREEAERERALLLGAEPGRVHVTGNTKFDTLLLSNASGTIDALAEAFRVEPGDRLLVAGSTHEGEETILLDVFAELRREHPELRLVIAPRYLERVGRVSALAKERGFSVGLRSAPGERTPVVLLDTIGELVHAYRLATLVFVGGSFTDRGGQNILEPAACGRAVLFGPHMENFHDSVQVLVGRGGLQVVDAQHLRRVAADLLAKPEKLAELGALAQAAVSSIRGASERDVALLETLLPPDVPSRRESAA